MDESFLTEQVARVSIPESGGAFMVAVMTADGGAVHAAAGTDPDGNLPTPGSAFRIASITKVFTSLALNAQGHPVISYWDFTNRDLKVVACNDPACAGVGDSISTVDPTGNGARHASLALNASGHPVIAYYDQTNGDLKLVVCNDPACAGGGDSISTVDSAGDVGQYPSLALNAQGYPVISYYDLSNGDLKVVACNDPACAGGGDTISALVSTGNVGRYTSLALNAQGYPVISYYDVGNQDLKVAACDDPACAGGGDTTRVIDSTGNVGLDTSLALTPSGTPIISYYDDTLDDLRAAIIE